MSDKKEWGELESAHQAFRLALTKLLAGDRQSRIAFLRKALRSERQLALDVLRLTSPEDGKELLAELIYLASSVHGHLWQVRDIICSLPRDWLVGTIGNVAEPIVANADDQVYRRLLELYLAIDGKLAIDLAKRAMLSKDAETREVGQEFTDIMSKRRRPDDRL